MNKRPMMPMWWGDYLRDTMGFEAPEHGAYLMLIAAYWSTGKPLPDDDDYLYKASRSGSRKKWKILRPKVEVYFSVMEGEWRHIRVDSELLRASERSAAASANAKQRLSGRSATRTIVLTPKSVKTEVPPLEPSDAACARDPEGRASRHGNANKESAQQVNGTPMEAANMSVNELKMKADFLIKRTPLDVKHESYAKHLALSIYSGDIDELIKLGYLTVERAAELRDV
jgi:uncharacterized protein YdaU (DUF1376 family)